MAIRFYKETDMPKGYGPMRVPEDENRSSSEVITKKLTKEEIDEIFKDIKPEEVKPIPNYRFKPKKNEEVQNESE